MQKVFAPGCALMLYKSHLAEGIHSWLNEFHGTVGLLDTCCRHDPQPATATEVINICPGCDKRFGSDYHNVTTVSFWEILAGSDSFAFPDYHGKKMSILDACPTRSNEKVQNAIRTLISRMNIDLIEPKKTRAGSTCCGDSFFGLIPVEEVKNQMRKRTAEMPENDVIVYCISCVKSVHIGGKVPRYIVDLLFGGKTLPKTFEPELWHDELDIYINKH